MIRTLALASVFVMSLLSVSIDCALSTVHAEEKKFTKDELQELYLSFLKREGYIPKLDEDGDISFKSESKNYYIFIDEKDPQFFRLVFPGFWEIENEKERARVLMAASHATWQTKCAKVFMVKDNVWASIEIFVAEPKDFEPVFSRSMAALRTSVSNFVAKMREQ